MKPYIQKEHPDLPDSYGITVYFVNGRKEDMEVASHRIVDTVIIYDANGNLEDQSGKKFRFEPATIPLFECWTKDDLLFSAPLSSISHFQFDKQFTKMKEIRDNLRRQEKMN